MSTKDNVKRAQKKFHQMLDMRLSLKDVEACAVRIVAFVNDGSVTWDQLGFTELEVVQRLHDARVRIGQQDFNKMANLGYAFPIVETYARRIRALVEEEKVTWAELGFTGGDVAKRLETAQERAGV